MIRIAFVLTTLVAINACAPSASSVKRKMIGFLEKFDRWDINGDGQLSQSELKDAERISGISSSELIKFYDTNGNGTISLVEAQAGVSRLDEAHEVVKDLETAQ